MYKENIGIDLDGVICNLYQSAFKVLKEMYPVKVKNDKFETTWESEYGLTTKQITDCFVECGKRGMLKDAPLYGGAKRVLYKIVRQYNIFIVSYRDYIPNAKDDTIYWLDSNKIPYYKLILTHNKFKIATSEKFVFFMDDNIEMCNRVAKTNTPTYLFSRPWNKSGDTDAMVKTIHSWNDVEDILDVRSYDEELEKRYESMLVPKKV